jgi:hypothetical protein
MTDTDLPKLVINGNNCEGLGNVSLQDVVMHNFCVPADQGKIQAWLDRTFAEPSGGAVRYTAVGGQIFLGFAEIGQLTNLDGPTAGHGWTSEIDVTVWLLAHSEQADGLGLRWIPAYLFVDSGPALVTGREVWGFPKQLGRFEFEPMPKDPAAARTYRAEGWVISPMGPESPARWATMFEVRPKPETPQRRQDPLATLRALASLAVERLTGDMTAFSASIATSLGAGVGTMAMLKQTPDTAQPALAAFQAIVETDARVTKLRGAGLTHDAYQVRVTSFDSHPYFKELGIASDWLDVEHGMWVDFDFEQQLGADIWRAGAGPQG